MGTKRSRPGATGSAWPFHLRHAGMESAAGGPDSLFVVEPSWRSPRPGHGDTGGGGHPDGATGAGCAGCAREEHPVDVRHAARLAGAVEALGLYEIASGRPGCRLVVNEAQASELRAA